MLLPEQRAVLRADVIPTLGGATHYLASGVRSTMHAANSEAFAHLEKAPLLCDPQTSGGLLIAVPAQARDALLEALHGAGYSVASVVGELTASEPTGGPGIVLL